MSTRSRQKVCIPCAISKRRCDRQLPACQRCIDRDVDCAYQPKRRRRELPANDADQHGTLISQGLVAVTPSDSAQVDLQSEDWTTMNASAFDLSLIDSDALPFDPMPASLDPSQTHVAQISYDSEKAEPWFLQPSTWVLQQSSLDPKCAVNLDYAPFIKSAEAMLQEWVRTGHNGFIHRRLYEYGMPACLQNAFITLAAYVGSTPAVKDLILQIADEHASALIRSSFPSTSGTREVVDLMARAHALFVYTFIRLFDGSVRLRASAEKQIPTLRAWVTRSLEVARRLRLSDCATNSHPGNNNSDFDMEYQASLELWQLWIIIESVRRSHIMIRSILNLYQAMTKGWVACSGAVMLTPSRQLWDAESATHWFDLSCTTHALLIPALEPQDWLSQHTGNELDEFVKLCWTCIVGTEKLECWIDRSRRC